ncbi:hypothetical protein GCM10023078_21150 [Gibbsiella greigii]
MRGYIESLLILLFMGDGGFFPAPEAQEFVGLRNRDENTIYGGVYRGFPSVFKRVCRTHSATRGAENGDGL